MTLRSIHTGQIRSMNADIDRDDTSTVGRSASQRCRATTSTPWPCRAAGWVDSDAVGLLRDMVR
ncbi:hypothetical protein BJ969_003583 [Saccharopolyspora gloriosae]|uniref:Uncharacterized protein n=1 Tax=Saccharopolyspora gloriosae TaxID=455344 RepID=A0A840NKE1_9PSEU|nr:hypothetical protein [Saccharopolyspora gloriosae]